MMMLIDRRRTAFLLCDLQERFMPALCDRERAVAVAQRMLSAAILLDIPIMGTEHVPDSKDDNAAVVKHTLSNQSHRIGTDDSRAEDA